MRVAYYCVEGSTLAWQRRLFDEGASVMVYHDTPACRAIGRGIVPIATSKEEWLTWGNADPATLWFFDCSGAGDLADRLRRLGKRVVGGGSFCDKLETNREYGFAFARRNGITIPPTTQFSSARASVEFMRTHAKSQTAGDGGWAWKANRFQGTSETFVSDAESVCTFVERTIIPKYGDNMTCFAQERIKGVAVSTARWWNGSAWVGPYEGTIENKKLMDGGVGPATGCALNVVWFYLQDEPKIAKALRFDALAESFRKANAPPGLYDINSILDKRGAWFLEWTPRLGVDSELTSQRGISSLTTLLDRVANGQSIDDLFNLGQAYYDVRLSVPPYPVDLKEIVGSKASAVGTAVEGIDGLWAKHFVAVGLQHTSAGFELADPFGFLGAAVAASPSLAKGYESIYAFLKKLKVQNLQYRTDAAEVIANDVAAMHKAGWETSPYLEVEEDAGNAA